MNLRCASEIFIDETYRVPDILVGADRPGECALTVASGGRTVASLTTRHLVAALEARCRSALRSCLGDTEPGLRTRGLRLDRVGSSGAGVFRLTAWVEQVDDDDGVVFSARAANDDGSRCEATISLAGTPSSGL